MNCVPSSPSEKNTGFSWLVLLCVGYCSEPLRYGDSFVLLVTLRGKQTLPLHLADKPLRQLSQGDTS